MQIYEMFNQDKGNLMLVFDAYIQVIPHLISPKVELNIL